MSPEFKKFDKIESIDKCKISITQKINGTNAQIYIFDDENGVRNVYAGSRNRWLTIDDDNYGFAKWVSQNATQLSDFLGLGRHFGEWAGLGIGSGEGLDHRRLFLFNWRRWNKIELPQFMSVVPLLGTSDECPAQHMLFIDAIMDGLKKGGSCVQEAKGFNRPEGIVIEIGGQFYKKVFEQEDVAWGKIGHVKKIYEKVDLDYLLQTVRLKKLILRDERYIRDYPMSLVYICKDYVKDLEEEGELIKFILQRRKKTDDISMFSTTKIITEDDLSTVRKELGRNIFPFVKKLMEEQIGMS